MPAATGNEQKISHDDRYKWQRPGPAARRGLGHALDLPELGHGAVERAVLLGHDRRATCWPPAVP
jgi:hypothetical protein